MSGYPKAPSQFGDSLVKTVGRSRTLLEDKVHGSKRLTLGGLFDSSGAIPFFCQDLGAVRATGCPPNGQYVIGVMQGIARHSRTAVRIGS